MLHKSSMPLPFVVLLAACGGDLNDPEGTFTSPGYPNAYTENVNCVWYISVQPGLRIRLTFTSFQLGGCPNDYVVVYDKNAENGLIER
jgi:hypothetical protein